MTSVRTLPRKRRRLRCFIPAVVQQARIDAERRRAARQSPPRKPA
jgi:hypothetical protein